MKCQASLYLKNLHDCQASLYLKNLHEMSSLTVQKILHEMSLASLVRALRGYFGPLYSQKMKIGFHQFILIGLLEE